MRARTVAGADGRTWSVRRNIEWKTPATGTEFEHDVDGGRGAVLLILSLGCGGKTGSAAETSGGYDLPAEHWTGMIRGRSRAKEETRVLVRSLRTRATPGHADSPLHPVN